ncbi:MAG: glycosyltransferase [Eubacteriales bacterium]|jgi:glycosyltransferase involved in cell wall biosynthesis|nr:glycosyltransferase [Eubacteriales bacterium]
MIKLLHVITDTNIGGAGKYLLTYLKNCDRRTFDISVVVPCESRLIPKIESLGFKVIQAQGIADKSASLKGIVSLYKILKSEKPQILHTHASLSARIAARLAGGAKIIYTRHTVFPQKPFLTKGIGKWLNSKAAAALSDKVIAVCKAAKKDLTDTGVPKESITVIYNGVDPQKIISEEEKASVREKFGISQDEKIVAAVARIEPLKGHEYIIEAAEEVKKQGIRARFVIAGSGSLEKRMRDLVKEKNLDDTVLFTGFLDDVSGLENIMDVQVNSSYDSEAASLSLLEGMSLGKPAVVSSSGGNGELIQDGVNGFVVPQRDPKAMAQAIVRLFTDDEIYNDFSKNAKNIFENNFTSKIMTENMEKFYKTL